MPTTLNLKEIIEQIMPPEGKQSHSVTISSGNTGLSLLLIRTNKKKKKENNNYFFLQGQHFLKLKPLISLLPC